ncbi:DUF4381 domain-containing protein [Pseudoxanthomonas putridarboris]|uniref:DUF4381 domain-containing protein n=1 Tax=Pseudoxanthomonas putridarboris TaxID=752605 RepID=A0ABU9J570_9GAMM
MALATLVLRDVHVPAAPPLWPPAPGWWLVAGVVLLACAVWAAWAWRRKRRLRTWQRWFDAAQAGPGSAQQVAAMSELLRRAARRVEPQADRLQGEAWLRFLDGNKGTAFSQGPGRLLLEGGYRRDVDAGELQAAAEVARARFLELMAGRR